MATKIAEKPSRFAHLNSVGRSLPPHADYGAVALKQTTTRQFASAASAASFVIKAGTEGRNGLALPAAGSQASKKCMSFASAKDAGSHVLRAGNGHGARR
jgi:hypothetical protein